MSASRPPDHTKSWLSTVSADLRRGIDAEVDGLRSSLEQRVVALQNALAANDAQLGQLFLNIEAENHERVQQAAASARQESEAAALAKLDQIREQHTSQLETSRSEFEAATRALEQQLADAERDISTVRQQRDERAAALDEAIRRAAVLEESSGQATLLRELAEAKLAEELQRSVAIQKQLDASHHELLLVKAEAESRRLENRLQDSRSRSNLEAAPVASHAIRTIAALRDGIDQLSSVRRDELLPTLLEQLGRHFFAVAVFAATPQGLRLWKAHAVDSSTPPGLADAHADGDSAVGRSFSERSRVRMQANGPGDLLGLWKQPVRHAVALPISAQGRVMAVVYGENRWEQNDRDPESLDVVAEILVECVHRQLNGGSSTSAAQSSPAQDLPLQVGNDSNAPATAAPADSEAFAVSRQASRVKMNEADVTIDGVSSRLVDISKLGAQVLSPTTLRPNRSIRMVLQNDNNTIACGARVVWARLELSNSVTDPQFRAGIQFIDVQGVAIEAFVDRQRQLGPMTQRPQTRPVGSQ